MNREAVTSALWERISAIDGVKTAGRKLRHFADVAPSEMPALFLGVDDSEADQERGRRPAWTLRYTAYIYCHESSAIGPSSSLNTVVDQVNAALEIQSSEFQAGQTFGPTTLGGTVHHAWITRVETDEGTMGDLGVALCSIEVLAT